MKLNYFTLFAACTSIAFSTAPSSINGVHTPQDFEAYQPGWYQDGETDPATHLTKFKSPDGYHIMHCAIPHQPCAETLYCNLENNLTVHKMRIEMRVGQPPQIVYYAMLKDEKLAVMIEILNKAQSVIRILANEVRSEYITERALALYAIAAKRLAIKRDDDDISYKVSIHLNIGLRQVEEQIAQQLAGIVQAKQFKKNINIIDSFR
ncbi:MAG TPA: hypothetical protein DIC42_04795 [Holosporales bacterium]|nr:hypothetical protein [Holosporales bacterium]